MTKFKRIILKLSLCLFSIIFTLLLVEGVLQVINPLPGVPKELYYQYDPVLGWVKQPGIEGKVVAAEYSITQKINSDSLLGPDYPIEKPQDEHRILILGDSFAEGYTVEHDQLFSEVMKKSLNARNGHQQYQVINAAVGAFSTDQQLLMFQEKGKKYCPDMTVLVFFFNDVWANAQPRAAGGGAFKPYFELIDGELELTNVPVPPIFLFSKPEVFLTGTDLYKYKTKKWLQDHSVLYGHVRDGIRSIPALNELAVNVGLANDVDQNRQLTVSKNQRRPVPGMFRVWEKNYEPEMVYAWQVTEAIMSKMKQETEAINSEFVVMYIPTAASVYPGLWQQLCKKYDMNPDQWDVEKSGSELGKICQKLNINFINTTESFRMKARLHEKDNKALFYVQDKHWSPGGHRLAGELLADYLLDYHVDGPEYNVTRGSTYPPTVLAETPERLSGQQ